MCAIIIIGFNANKFFGTPHFVNFCNQSIDFTMTYDQQIINNDIFTKKTTVNLQVYRRNHTSYHTRRKVYCYAHGEYTKSRTNMDDCYLSALYIHLTEIGLHPGQFTDQCKVNIMSVLDFVHRCNKLDLTLSGNTFLTFCHQPTNAGR